MSTPCLSSPLVPTHHPHTHTPQSIISPIRRKPKITYKSPSSHLPADLRIEGPRTHAHAHAHKPTRKPPATPLTKPLTAPKLLIPNGFHKLKQYPRAMGPPLPLYHPLGRLALSLPELDPATLGLVPTALNMGIPSDGRRRQPSGRTRRPAAKLRDTEDADDSGSLIGILEKEKPLTPRRRRGAPSGGGAGAGAGGVAKRKRKEPDDGDATYPAKRPNRVPRGGRGVVDEVSVSEDVGGAGSASVAEVESEAQEEKEREREREKRPERRSTRSRGVLKRRGSSGSEATTVSLAANVRNGEGVDGDEDGKEVGDGRELKRKAKEEAENDEGGPVSPKER